MSVNSLPNRYFVPALKSALRRGLAALPGLAALLFCLSLAAPAWAQILVNYTPKQSDADALARIKSVNDAGNRLTGANWTPLPPATLYNNSNGVTWDGLNPAQVINLDVGGKELTGKFSAEGMASLAGLTVGNNRLTGLDVSKNTAMGAIIANNNQITSLDVSKNIALVYLYANNNRLTSLDVSQNTALFHLDVSLNQLTGLDVRENTALTSLNASNNQLASLDVSKNTALTELYASNNQLTSLDVSKNTTLISLHASNNQLTSLDVSKNTALVYLYANNNQLTSLDVSKTKSLQSLYVSGNPISSLNLTGLNSLTSLGIAETNLKLSGLNLPIPGQLILLQVDPGQLEQENFSALTSLTELAIDHRTAADVTLAANSSLPAGQITALYINTPQARSLDFSNHAPGLTLLNIGAGRLERINGAAKLDSAKFNTLTILNNRLPLSQVAPLASAVYQNSAANKYVGVATQSKVWFESLSARNKPFDLAAQLAPERALLGKDTVFRLLPKSAVTASADGTVSVAENLALKEGVDYTLSADGKLTINKSGDYYLLMTNPALYNWSGDANQGEIMSLSGLLSYQARLYAELAAIGGNPNAYRLGRALDWAVDNGKEGPLQAMLDKIDNAATDAEALHYLNQMHGESVPSAVQYFTNNMRNLFRVVDGFAMTPGDDIILGGGAALDDYAPGAGDGDYAAHPGQPWRVKLRLTGDWDSMDGHDGYYGYDGRSFGGALALERDVMEGPSGRFTLGFAGAFSHSEVDFDNYDNEGDSDDWAMAVYGRYQYNDWFAGARVGYGQSAASVQRNLPALGLTANSNPDLDYYSAALFTGYDFYFGGGSWRLTPVAGVNWLRTNAGSFDETGAGDYNLSYDSDNYDSLELLANVTLAKRIELASGAALTPRANVGIGYETADNQVSMKSTFGDIPDFAHFGVDSPDVGRTRLLAGAGIDWHVTDHVDLSLEYQGSFQEDYDDHMGLASFKVSW